jgi:LysR family glycine cleavage system transcriptional activator
MSRKTPDVNRGLQFDTLHMAFEAASQGLGVALGRKPLVNSELASGRLVAVWGHAYISDTAYWLVTAESGAKDPIIAAFRTWITSEATIAA